MNFRTAQKGHAHVYADGKKIGRACGPDVHLADLTEGEHEIRVTLNANTHDDYLLDSEMVEAVTTVNVTNGVEATDDDSHMDDHDDGHDDDRMTDSYDDAVMHAEAESHEVHSEPVKE